MARVVSPLGPRLVPSGVGGFVNRSSVQRLWRRGSSSDAERAKLSGPVELGVPTANAIAAVALGALCADLALDELAASAVGRHRDLREVTALAFRNHAERQPAHRVEAA